MSQITLDLIGALAALLDPFKFLAFGGLGFLYAQAKNKESWVTPAALAVFVIFVWFTPTLHREYTLRPSHHVKEPGFDLLEDKQWLASEYAIHWKYFITVNSQAAKLEVMRRIDHYKKNCQILTGWTEERDYNYSWQQRCDEYTRLTTAFAGAIQFGLVLWITSYVKARRRREYAGDADIQ